jgi:hypothetical protein
METVPKAWEEKLKSLLPAYCSRCRKKEAGPILNDPLCMSALQEQLDPFIRLAGKTTRNERYLLHHCKFTDDHQAQVKQMLTDSRLYCHSGCSLWLQDKGALYCPVRDTTVANMRSNHLWLLWVLLAAEYLVTGVEVVDKDTTHLSRKGYLYRSMQNYLTDGTTRYSDNTITALSFAGLVEARAGALDKSREYLIACKAVICARGGIQSMPMALSFSVLITFLWLGTGAGAFSDSHAVEFAIEIFRTGVLQLQQNRHLVQKHAGSSTSSASCETYCDARDLAFGPSSPIRPFIEPVYHDSSLPQQRIRTAILWVLNMMMYEQQQDWRSSTDFLKSFYRYVESSGVTNPSNLMAWTVVLALRFCGAQFDGESRKNVDESVLRWWEVVDVVELLQLSRRSIEARFWDSCHSVYSGERIQLS